MEFAEKWVELEIQVKPSSESHLSCLCSYAESRVNDYDDDDIMT
jgi:hypothetical protein